MYIKEEVTSQIVIEKSRFIAYIKPCFSQDEYKEYLKLIRKKYYDSSHVCSALLLKDVKRSSDDNEPSGTAGIPILSVLEKHNLVNTCALVVRYFGGIKLGAGGLVRAYGQAVSEALKKSKLVDDVLYNKYELKLTYDLANKVEHIIQKEAIHIEHIYDEEVIITYLTLNNDLENKIAEITSGIKPTSIGQEIVQVDI